MSKTITSAPVRNHMQWTTEEDELLTAMAKMGASTGEIATQLGRTRSSVWARKSKLGIKGRLSHTERGSEVPFTVSTKSSKKATTTENPELTETVEIPSIMNANGLEEAVRLHKEYGVKITVIQLG